MINADLIRKLIEEKIFNTNKYIVDIKVSTSKKITVSVDSDTNISIAECVEISRHIELNLDREQEDFELEVSSPGLTQPFKVFKQYVKNIGREVSVLCNDGKKINGKLVKAEEEGIELEVSKKKDKKNNIIENQYIPLKTIKETKILLKF